MKPLDLNSFAVGALILTLVWGSIFVSWFENPGELIAFMDSTNEGKKFYLIQESIGGGPHIRCVDYEYYDGIGICKTDSIWRFGEVGIEYDWEAIAKASSNMDSNIEQCKMVYAMIKPYCEQYNLQDSSASQRKENDKK